MNKTSQLIGVEVMVRIRPYLSSKQDQNEIIYQLPIDLENNAIKIFPMETQQEEVFEYVWTGVQQILEGYNSTIFAYGQTASGKTHSMLGPKGQISKNLQLMGIIPRVCTTLFSQIARRNEEFRLSVGLYELYQNRIKDLQSGNNLGYEVSQLIYTEVTSTEEILKIVQQCGQKRVTCQTEMNEHSSRSHLILSIQIEKRTNIQKNKYQSYNGVLNLIDLAGSEDISRSNVKDLHLKEALNINSDLFHLHRVFNAIQKKDDFIPFRDSTLTRILQNVLIGNSKTYFLTHVSPDENDILETINTLKYAQLASKIKTKNYIQMEIQRIHDPMHNDYEDNLPYNRQTIKIQTNYGDIFARISGHNGQLILFIHGSGPENSSMYWNYFTFQFLQQCNQYFYVAIDCPGYGRSSGDKQTIRSYPCEFIKEIIMKLGYQKAYCLIGSSQGAASIFNCVYQDPTICDYFSVMDPVSHDPYRFTSIKQPCILVYDTEDEGHPVKIGRIVQKIIKHSQYFEFSHSQDPNYLKQNFVNYIIKLFSTRDQENNLLGPQLNQDHIHNIPLQLSTHMRLHGGVLSWIKPYGREQNWSQDLDQIFQAHQNTLENQAIKKNHLIASIPQKILIKPNTCGICDIIFKNEDKPFYIQSCNHNVCQNCSLGTLNINSNWCPIISCQQSISPPIKISRHTLKKNQIFIIFGNNAEQKDNKINFNAFIKDPQNSIKSVGFDINPGYPKSAVRVKDQPFELNRSMERPFPCNFIIQWKNTSYNDMIITYQVYVQNFHRTVLVNFLTPSDDSKKKKNPIIYNWQDRNPQEISSTINIY